MHRQVCLSEQDFVKEWKYTDKNVAGKHFFNEMYLSLRLNHEVDGGTQFSYTFTITQDDIINVN